MIQPTNSVLIQGATLDDIEKMIDRAIAQRMTAFAESLLEKPPVLVRRKEAAKIMGVSLVTLDAYAKAGILRAQHFGGRVYYDAAELEPFQNRLK